MKSDFSLQLDRENKIVGIVCNRPDDYIEREGDPIEKTEWVVNQAIDDYRDELKYPTLHFFVSPENELYVFAVDDNGRNITIESEHDYIWRNFYLRADAEFARTMDECCAKLHAISNRRRGIVDAKPLQTFDEMREEWRSRSEPYIRPISEVPASYRQIDEASFVDLLLKSSIEISSPSYALVSSC